MINHAEPYHYVYNLVLWGGDKQVGWCHKDCCCIIMLLNYRKLSPYNINSIYLTKDGNPVNLEEEFNYNHEEGQWELRE